MRIQIGRALLVIFAVGFSVWFVRAAYRAWTLQTSDLGYSCAVPFDDIRKHFSYFELRVKEQQPSEPYFNGAFFLTLGSESGRTPRILVVTFSAERNYGSSEYRVPLVYDESSNNLWSGKEIEASVIRASGSPRDFPFDSTTIDFDVTVTPAQKFSQIKVRNANPSFYIPCETMQSTDFHNGKYHVFFELRRHPLVLITAAILLLGGVVFLCAIMVFVRRESLPTAIASYFFSLWSIRGILNSEIRIFPTMLDLAILCLCVLLLIGLALRLAFWKSGNAGA